MKDNGIVYGFVGVIGSGKTYRAEKVREESIEEHRDVIIGDFSEGIRQTLMRIFTGRPKAIQLDGHIYAQWKDKKQLYELPCSSNNVMPEVATLTGRLLMQRTGEYLKELAGDSVWARWTARYVLEQTNNMDDEQLRLSNVVFGSLRFLCEAAALFEVAEKLGKEVRIIFCNYKSNKYELNDHVSEAFARHFVELGYKDGMDITPEVARMVKTGKI